MNSRKRRQLAAVIHNKEREAQKALALDRKLNPEKYKQKRSNRKGIKRALLFASLGLSATAFDDRLMG